MESHWTVLLGGVPDILKLVQPDAAVLKGLVIGVVVVALLLLAYRGVLMLRDKAKSSPFLDRMKGAMARTPSAVADPAKRARLDDLRKKYEEGVDKFRQAGKDLYSLPWYLLVGPAGSGKTEAMRHCKVGFPPGLQDCFQGAGGTVNMHWWFTNQAVVLDTAGRMFMEDAALQGGSEWREFLKMLRASRPNAPVNGMLLVIGVDSLIKDTAEQIEGKAGHIAKQLDTIQRTLDVRFPVYVVITKCDLITGFKEFFDKIDDPQLQHQILGWSNPAPLDEAFRAETVDDHIKTIRTRLLKRRATLLMDPVHTEDPQARRTEQVDELFALPDNMAKIAPRLRRYLEIIFQAGEWSPKPLFLRGIYFTSSMRQGKALDEDLAAALGVGVDAIPGGKVYDEERSFFLRDVFTSKIFREKGLVSRASNVQKEQAGRKRLLLGAGIAVAAALIGLTVLSSMKLREAVRDPIDRWREIAAWMDKGNEIIRDAGSGPAYFGASEKKTEIEGREVSASPVALIRESRRLADSPLSMGFLSFGRVFNDVNDNQRAAHKAVVARLAAVPMVRWAREELKGRRLPWSPLATGALAEMVAAETRARGATPAREADGKAFAAGSINPAPFLAYFIRTQGPVKPEGPAAGELGVWGLKSSEVSADDFQTLTDELKGLDPASYAKFGLAGTDESLREIAGILAPRAKEGWREQALGGGGLREIRQLDEALGALRDGLRGLEQVVPGQAPASLDAYNAAAQAFADAAAQLKGKRREAVAQRLQDWDGGLKLQSPEDLAARAQKDVDDQVRTVALALPDAKDVKSKPSKPLEELADLLKKSRDDALEGLLPQVKQLLQGFAQDRDKQALIGPGAQGDERGYQTALRLIDQGAAVMTKAEPAADWMAADAAVAQLGADAETARKAIGQALERAPALTAYAETARRAVSVGRGGRAGAVVKAYLDGLDAAKSPLEAVQNAKEATETTLPRIPMTALDGTASLPKTFSPSAAGRLFSGWAAINAETAGLEKAWLVAEAPTRDRLAAGRKPMAEFGQQFVDQWLTVLKRGEVRAFPSWQEFHAAMRRESPDPVVVHQGLRPLYTLAESCVRTAGRAFERQDWTAKADEIKGKLAKIESADAGPTGVIAIARDALRDLGEDAAKARTAVAGRLRDGAGAMRDFTVVADGDAPDYWKSLVLNGFQALAAEYKSRCDAQLAQLADLAKFPLVSDGSPRDALTVEQLVAAKAILDGLPVSAAGRPPVLDGLGRLQPACRDLMESGVFGGNDRLREAVVKARGVAEVLTKEDGTRLIESIQGAGESAPIPGRPEVGNLSTVLRLWGHSEDPGQRVAADREPVNLTNNAKVRALSGGAGAGGQSLSLYFLNDVNPEAERVFAGPWAAPQLVLTQGATNTPGAVPGRASEWLVPVVVPFGGAEYKMWIKVRLRQPLPTQGEWPKSADLKSRG